MFGVGSKVVAPKRTKMNLAKVAYEANCKELQVVPARKWRLYKIVGASSMSNVGK
jgi:hypothetical protein